MSSTNSTPRKSNDLDFLKTIVGDERSGISKISEEDERPTTPRLTLPPANQNENLTSSKPPLKVKVQIQDKRTVGDGYGERLSRTEMWARGELDDSELDQYEFKRVQRKPPRPKSGRPISGRPISGRPQSGKMTNNDMTYETLVDPAAYRLERKYLELKELLMGSRPSEGLGPNKDLVKLATRMARKYHMEAQGVVPGSQTSSKGQHAVHMFSPRSQDLINGTTSGPQRHHILYSPRSDQGADSYILIDGTGAVIQTKQVYVSGRNGEGKCRSNPDSDVWGMEPDAKRRLGNRGRARVRRPPSGKKPASKKNAWGSKSTSQATSSKSSPNKTSPRSRSSSRSSSRSRSHSREKAKKEKDDHYYSDSFTSDSSRSRSRSTSRNKKNTCDMHLKHTKNEKLLEWLKEKDRVHKENRKQKRKERKEKRKAERLKIKKKQELQEKSEKVIEEWMKNKGFCPPGKETRDRRDEDEEFVVLDEMLDLKEHGAKVDPSTVPAEVLQKSEGNTEKKEEGEAETKEGNTEKSDNNENEENVENGESKENKRPLTAHPPPNKPEGQRTRFRRSGRVQSAKNVPFGRPVSAKQGRFSEGAKEKVRQHKEKILQEQEAERKKRVSYDDWLKSKRSSSPSKAGDKGNEVQPELKKKITYEQWLKEKGQDRDKSPTKQAGDKSPAKEASSSDKPKPEVKFVEKTEEKKVHVIRGADSKVRPKSAKKPTVPKQPKPDTTSSEKPPQPQESLTTPRPPVKKTEAYKAVKHEQESWENFADHVWKEANVGEEVDVVKSADRPEPQGSDAPDDESAKSPQNDDIAENQADSNEDKTSLAKEDEGTDSESTPSVLETVVEESEKDNANEKVNESDKGKATEKENSEANENVESEENKSTKEEEKDTNKDSQEKKDESNEAITEGSKSTEHPDSPTDDKVEQPGSTAADKEDEKNKEETLEVSDREMDGPESVGK